MTWPHVIPSSADEITCGWNVKVQFTFHRSICLGVHVRIYRHKLKLQRHSRVNVITNDLVFPPHTSLPTGRLSHVWYVAVDLYSAVYRSEGTGNAYAFTFRRFFTNHGLSLTRRFCIRNADPCLLDRPKCRWTSPQRTRCSRHGLHHHQRRLVHCYSSNNSHMRERLLHAFLNIRFPNVRVFRNFHLL